MRAAPMRPPPSLVIGSALAVVSLLAAGPARADDAADAKLHYQKATAHFAIGEYREAAAEYEEAFKLKQDPALLFDAAQSHRLGGDNQRALLQYKNVVQLFPGSSYARDAQDRIEKLEQAMAAGAPPATPPQPASGEAATAAAGALARTTPPPASAAPATPPPAPIPAASGPPILIATEPAASPAPRPLYARWWFWAGAGAVVAAGIVVAILATRSNAAWSNLPDVHGAP